MRTARAVDDAVVILTMRIMGTVLWLLYTIILARTLSQGDFAVALYVMNFSLLAVLVITLGRDVALLRFATKAWAGGARDVVRGLLSRSRRLLLGTGALLTVALLGAVWMGLDTPVTKDWSIALLCGLLTMAAAQMGLNRECLRAINQVWQSQLGLNFTRSVVPIIGSAVVIVAGEQMTASMALTLFLGSLLLSLLIEEFFLSRVDWSRTADATAAPSRQDVASAGMALWPGDMANALMMRAAGLVGAVVLPPAGAAMLLAAERIAGLAQFPIAAASQATAPRIAEATNADQAAVQKALNQGSLMMTLGAAIGCCCAAVLAWPALWGLGPDYLAALPATLVLICGSLSWGVFGLAQLAMNLTGWSHWYSPIAIVMMIVTVLGVWIGAEWMGVLGAALGYSVGWWMANIGYSVALFWLSGLRTGWSAMEKKTLKHAIHTIFQVFRR